jgi:hypothetical protein
MAIELDDGPQAMALKRALQRLRDGRCRINQGAIEIEQRDWGTFHHTPDG